MHSADVWFAFLVSAYKKNIFFILGQFVPCTTFQLTGTVSATFQLTGTVSTLYYISAYWDSPNLVAFASFLAM